MSSGEAIHDAARMAEQKKYEVRRATLAEVVTLRHEVLRAGMPVEAAQFDGDDAADTRHFGAFAEGVNVGCVSYMAIPCPLEPETSAWQLRGMATAPDWQGRGVGRALLSFAEPALIDEFGPGLLWCNARVPAVGFYVKQGWHIVSDIFEIPTAGPHRRMMKREPALGR